MEDVLNVLFRDSKSSVHARAYISMYNINVEYRICRLFDEKYTALYDGYKKAYAEALHRWELLDARAQVLKHLSASSFDVQKDVELQNECRICGKISPGPQCANCKGLSFQCIVCHVTVRGS